MSSWPRRGSQFLARLEAANVLSAWRVAIAPRDDALGRVAFHLASDPARLAAVEHSHGALLVCLRAPGQLAGEYWFDLHRLHQHAPRWSWSRQVAEKTWHRGEHLQLLQALEDLYPASAYA